MFEFSFGTNGEWQHWPCLWSDTRHLFDIWGKNRGPEFDTFSPGTEYRQELIFSSGLNAQSSPFFPCCERQAMRYSTPMLLVTNKYYWCWIGVVDLPRDRHGSASNKPPAHQLCIWSYLFICALRIWLWGGLRKPTFCIRRADNRQLDRNLAHPQDSISNSHRPMTKGVQSSRWLLHQSVERAGFPTWLHNCH
jgi:hypothetical protein